MTSEEAFKNIKYMSNHSRMEHDRRSLRVALDIMQKYQKIEEIISDTPNIAWTGELIRKVIEDEN